jgi:hypothetical protein
MDSLDKVLLIVTGIAIGVVATITFIRGLQPAVKKEAKTTYNNEEVWEIIKDSRGRTTGLRVHRHAEEA